MHKLLIVNDDNKLCKIFSESNIIRENQITCVSNFEDFLKLPKSEQPHLIILVSASDEFNEEEFNFLLTVKSEFPKVPSVLVVTKLMFPQYIPLFDLGIDSIISNYSSDEEILNEIGKVLGTIF